MPFIAAGKARGVIAVQDVDHEYAFTESDKRLLATLAGSLSVALENARLHGRDAATGGRARDREQRGAGPRRTPRARRSDRARGRAGARDVQCRHRLRRAARRVLRADRLPLLLRDRRAADPALIHVRRGDHLAHPAVAGAACDQPVAGRPGDRLHRNAVALLPRRADRRRRPGNRGHKRPEHEARGPVRRGRCASSSPRSQPTWASRSGTRNCTRRPGVAATRWPRWQRSGASSRRPPTSPPCSTTSPSGPMSLLEAETSAVYLAEPESGAFRAAVALGRDAEEIEADRILEGEGIIGDIAARGEAEVVDDALRDPRALSDSRYAGGGGGAAHGRAAARSRPGRSE